MGMKLSQFDFENTSNSSVIVDPNAAPIEVDPREFQNLEPKQVIDSVYIAFSKPHNYKF